MDKEMPLGLLPYAIVWMLRDLLSLNGQQKFLCPGSKQKVETLESFYANALSDLISFLLLCLSCSCYWYWLALLRVGMRIFLIHFSRRPHLQQLSLLTLP